MSGQRCEAITEAGAACKAWALRDGTLCFLHDPSHAAAADEARRLGGLRRRREAVVGQSYDFEGFKSAADALRLLDIAALDTLPLENTIARNRTLITAALAGARVLEQHHLEPRMQAIEDALGRLKADREQR